MKLAILTSTDMPNMLPYDIEVISLLNKKGIETSIIIWDKLIETEPQDFNNYDAVLIRTIWDYFKKYDQFQKLLDFLESSNVPVFNQVEILRWNMNKKYLSELQNEGFDIIPTVFNLNNENDSFVKALSFGWKKMILKPVISGNSYHTFVVGGDEGAKFELLSKQYFHRRPFILQEFIPDYGSGTN